MLPAGGRLALRPTRVRIFADRFLVDDADVVDLATGEIVRLHTSAAAARPQARDRIERCDQLSALRHPLLVPIVDYGLAEGAWFEARMALPALRGTRSQIHRTALHVVRFLRAAGVEASRDMAAESVRPAIEAAGPPWRPIGHRLRAQPALEPVLAAIQESGGDGLICITVAGAEGSGLRTVRLQAARAARLAGFIPVDGRIANAAMRLDRTRHYCVLEWLPSGHDLPLLLAAVQGGRRHVWLRFVRDAPPGPVLTLDRFSTRELIDMVYADAELGPAGPEIQAASSAADGLPGRFIELLSRRGRGAARLWVHETAPAYVVHSAPVLPQEDARTPHAGVRRILRLVDAARSVAAAGRHTRAERVLRRAIPALVARGAFDAAAGALREYARLCVGRGRAADALAMLDAAHSWPLARPAIDLNLLEAARAMLELLKLPDARMACGAILAGTAPALVKDEATVLLARARSVADGTLAGASIGDEIARRCAPAAALAAAAAVAVGAYPRAGALARHTLAIAAEADHASRADAHVVLMQIAASTGDTAGAAHHALRAKTAAQASRCPSVRLLVEAARIAAGGGTMRLAARADRLRRAAESLSPLCGHDIAKRLTPSMPARTDPAVTLERLLGMVLNAPGDEEALKHLCEFLLVELKACAVSVRGSRRQPLALSGRAWPGDEPLADLVMTGGARVARDTVMAEAGEPILTGGIVIGCLAARWLPGGERSVAAARELMRLASVAAAPAVTALNAPRPAALAAPGPDDLLGRGPSADRVRELVRRAAAAPYPVLIEGESGSGKELVARAIHARSTRRARRFCAVNCAALTDDLLEAELFGHARGAFTGAIAERAGLFEEADQGTLFLDEVAELSPRAQAKLLRVLQEGEVRRVGETVARRVDVRVVAATNRPLVEEVDAGRFRADLRFRLDVLRIPVPALRERADEIAGLADRIWAEAAERVGTHATLASDFLGALSRYDWPGNVRELQNVLAAVAVHAPRRGQVHASVLPAHVARLAGRDTATFEAARVDFERRFVRAALARAGGRRGVAARQLGLSRQGLAKMMKRLGIVEILSLNS